MKRERELLELLLKHTELIDQESKIKSTEPHPEMRKWDPKGEHVIVSFGKRKYQISVYETDDGRPKVY